MIFRTGSLVATAIHSHFICSLDNVYNCEQSLIAFQALGRIFSSLFIFFLSYFTLQYKNRKWLFASSSSALSLLAQYMPFWSRILIPRVVIDLRYIYISDNCFQLHWINLADNRRAKDCAEKNRDNNLIVKLLISDWNHNLSAHRAQKVRNDFKWKINAVIRCDWNCVGHYVLQND